MKPRPPITSTARSMTEFTTRRSRSAHASREDLLGRHEADAAIARGVRQELQHHDLQRVVDLPVMGGQTEVAAGVAGFVERCLELLERRAGDEAVTAKLGVAGI